MPLGINGLTPEMVRVRLGWKSTTSVSRSATRSRGIVKAGGSLAEDDFPLPVQNVGRTPLWDAADIDRYLKARLGTGHGKRVRHGPSVMVRADTVLVGDLLVDGGRQTVREVVTAKGWTTLWVSARRRDVSQSRRYRSTSRVEIKRAKQPREEDTNGENEGGGQQGAGHVAKHSR